MLFTAHSLPQRVLDTGDPYPDELRATAAAVADRRRAGTGRGAIGWQTAGRTPEPWLGPDVLEVIDELAADPAVDGLLVCPCGFVADHLEVLYDLDIEARERADGAGLAFARTASMNDDPAVLGALADRRRRPADAGARRRRRDHRADGGVRAGRAGAERRRSSCARPIDRLGGKLRTSPFAGLPAVDEGGDAFLARVPARHRAGS